MWEAVASALLIHIGKTAIDKFWSNRHSSKSLVVNQTGNVTRSTRDEAGRTVIRKDLTGLRSQKSESLFGNLYLPSTVQGQIVGDEIGLVLVFGEENEQVLLFEADINHGYEIDLPFGSYSIFVFIIDPEEPDLFDAEIYAVGFPTAQDVDLSGIQTISLDEYEDIWDLVDISPVRIKKGGPFYLDFILFDTDVELDLPKSFSEIFQEEEQELGYICSHCETHVTSIICSCGASIDDIACNSCGSQFPLCDICPNCYTDIESIVCYQCQRIISALNCPGCGNLLPI